MLCLCIYCVTILFGCWSHDESPPPVCDMMAVFSTAGVDGVHLSAGAEDGNSGQCQVERCPHCLYRWMELHINLLYTLEMWTIKVLTIIHLQH